VGIELRDADGRSIYRTSVDVDRYTRAEFPAADGSLDGRWIEREQTSFVVRVPDEGETLEVKSARSRSVSQFAVRALPESVRASLVPRIRGDAGDPANRMDLVVMGDGYTAAEAGQFDADVQRITSQFFGIIPYNSYRSFVNVTSYFVPSPQSGADHPNCSADPSAQPDPKQGQTVNTAFDASYCSFGLQRLLDVNHSKVFTAAALVPDWDMILVVVNDTMYGGAGGSISVVSTHDQAVGVAQHEYGHTFAGLADEYSTAYPGYPSCSDISGNTPCEPNVTNQTVRESIKWSPWIESSTAIPTPASFPRIGLFLGARYQSTGMYRPRNQCLMGVLGQPFCAVCAQTYVLRLYTGWHGVPARGIDLIESVSPASANVTATTGQAVAFRVTVLNPTGQAARIRWYVDGVEVANATSATYNHFPDTGTHSVEVRVSDPTLLVNAAMAGGALTKSRTWTVQATPLAAPKKRRSVH
jgi:hypothetical protein